MKLVEYKTYYLIDDFFAKSVIAGFTKSILKGQLPYDATEAFSFLNPHCQLAYLKQQHSTDINFIEKEGLYTGDALFSGRQRLALIVRTADCLPLFFASTALRIIGIVHMGWRGAKEGILGNLQNQLFLKKNNLSSFKVIAGVGLRKCCYRVGKEFLGYTNLRPFLEERSKQVYFDPLQFAKKMLLTSGIRDENFLDLNICSFCSPIQLYSFRRDATNFRTLSFIVRQYNNSSRSEASL